MWGWGAGYGIASTGVFDSKLRTAVLTCGGAKSKISLELEYHK